MLSAWTQVQTDTEAANLLSIVYEEISVLSAAVARRMHVFVRLCSKYPLLQAEECWEV